MNRILPTTVLSLAALTAQAQAPAIPESAYRSGQPEVLSRVPPPGANGPVFSSAAFSAAYAKAGKPAMAVLWNREFSDMLQQSTAQTLTIDESAAAVSRSQSGRVSGYSADRTTVGGPGYVASETNAGAATYAAGERRSAVVGNTTVTLADTKTSQAQRRGPVERVDLQMRSSFLQTIVSSGVRLVDRNVIMRTTAAGQKGGNLDTQQIETEAIAKHAAMLMEILNTRDAQSPTGWSTYVSVKRLKDGMIVMEGYLDGQLPEGTPKPPAKFEADPRGGFRQVYEPVKVGDVGKRAAEQTLARLGEALAR
ncbi:MAG: hypothetical protein WCO67_20900 [Betaproteobacteria bacterium]